MKTKLDKTNTAKAKRVRKLFKFLSDKCYKIDFENDCPGAIAEREKRYFNLMYSKKEQAKMGGHSTRRAMADIRKELKGKVIIELTAGELMSLGTLFLGLYRDNWSENSDLISKTIGYNFQFPYNNFGFDTNATLWVYDYEWEWFYKEIVPMFELLSKKQKMDDDRYVAASLSILRSVISKLNM